MGGQIRKAVRERRKNRRMIGLHPAGREHAIHIALRITEARTHCTYHMQFHLCGERAMAPGGELRIKTRHHRVRRYPHGCRRGIE